MRLAFRRSRVAPARLLSRPNSESEAPSARLSAHEKAVLGLVPGLVLGFVLGLILGLALGS